MQKSQSAKGKWVQENFEQVASSLPAQGNGVGTLRKDAFERFQELGFPSTKLEAWKYTNVSKIAGTEFRIPQQQGKVEEVALRPYFDAIPEAARVVFIDGKWSEEFSDLSSIGKSSSVLSLRSLLEGSVSDTSLAEKLKSTLGSIADSKAQSFAALNTAFLDDGVVVYLPKNSALESPLHILFVASDTDTPQALHPRVLLVAEQGAEATIVESYVGLTDKAYFTTAVTEAVVEENATIDHYRLQFEGSEAYHVSSVDVLQKRSSSFATNAFSFGGNLVRNEVNPSLQGEGIHTTMNGLSVLTDSQHVDNHTVIDHAKPNCESYEWYKGIYAHKSRGVFSGTIIVQEDAQKTNAFQSNQSLLLSDEASVDTKPQLKIWADDVKCSHGATIGQLDEDALFYLRSRGLKKKAALELLIQAFAGDITTQIKPDALREFVEERLLKKLEQAHS